MKTEKEIIEEMQQVVEQMRLDDIEDNPDIVDETFDDSNFWHKLAHLLFVYYLYDSPTTVKAAGYANFPIKGYQFYEFNSEDTEILKNDWTIVRNFIRYLHDEFDNYEDEYPRISYE